MHSAAAHPMDYDLVFEHRVSYLYAAITGRQDSLRIDQNYFGKILKECRAAGYQCVLIEENLGTQLSTADMFYAAEGAAALDIGGLKVAFVDRFPSHIEGNRFGETVAKNRGLNVKLFSNIDAAKAWLGVT